MTYALWFTGRIVLALQQIRSRQALISKIGKDGSVGAWAIATSGSAKLSLRTCRFVYNFRSVKLDVLYHISVQFEIFPKINNAMPNIWRLALFALRWWFGPDITGISDLLKFVCTIPVCTVDVSV